MNWKVERLESFLCVSCSVHLKSFICSSERIFNFCFFPRLLYSLGTAPPNSLEAQHRKPVISRHFSPAAALVSPDRVFQKQEFQEVIKTTGPLQSYTPEEIWRMKSSPQERANTFLYKHGANAKFQPEKYSLKIHSVTKLISNRPKGTHQKFSCKLYLHGFRWCLGG